MTRRGAWEAVRGWEFRHHSPGTVTAKLRPKEDSDCRSFWSSASAQIRSRQDDPDNEDELERAFKVESPQAIGRRAM